MSHVLPGSVVLITGASGSIGFEIAAQAAAAGAVVAVHGSQQQSVDDALVRLRLRHPDAHLLGVPGDFLEEGVIDSVIAKVTAEAGRLTALIHCAHSLCDDACR
jgi:3-oxoacyl-[acyl-carrier protein] reductase